MRAHCMRARFRDRSWPRFIACRDDVHPNFNRQASVIDRYALQAERARPLGRGGSELADCGSPDAVRAGHFGAKQ